MEPAIERWKQVSGMCWKRVSGFRRNVQDLFLTSLAMLLLNVFVTLLSTAFSTAAPLADAPSAPELQSERSQPSDKFFPTAESRKWSSIVLHHSATVTGDVASIDAVHRTQKDRSGNPWLGIGYHFVIGNGQKMADGEIQPTFRWLRQLAGAHAGTRTHNDFGIGICLIGNFEETAPTARQLVAVRDLLKTLTQRYAIPREQVVGHRDVQATACPGRLFPWEQVMADLRGPQKGS